MARRKKSSFAEDLIDLVAMLPWYVGLLMAGFAYVVFHSVSAAPVQVATKPGDMTGVMFGVVWRGLANFAQYVIPFLCLIGAGVSAWRRRVRRALVDNVTASSVSSVIDGMTWQEFELLVGEGFRQQGYSVLESGGGGADGGIDLVLRKGSESFLVQCKQWHAFKVGVQVVRELYGVMAAKGAAGGFVVTSGRFTDDAKDFASGRNVTLIDGPKLHKLLQAASSRAGQPVSPAARKAAPQAASTTTPACPKCSRAMVRRTARKGANAGNEFWGCPDYPRCRGTA
ncbi:restriction endonuclease [Variovorax sp. GT1P44]|uniref:restriction endonuclease n=1 Tax=Variovorax sp. GT1P44 TaxID=3443742 RepID=UPI003F46C94A